MKNSDIWELVKGSKRLRAKVPNTVLLHKHYSARGYGEMHQAAKLTAVDVFQIRHEHQVHGVRICDLARKFSISYNYAAKVAKERARTRE